MEQPRLPGTGPSGTGAEARTRRRTRRAGAILLAAGVAVWPTWGVLLVAGRAPHVAWVVPLHLALVVPGGTLLRRARTGAPLAPRRRLGSALLAIGVLAWVPYLYLTEVGGMEISSLPFLVWHLSGVIPGAVLRYAPLGRRRTAETASQGGEPNGPGGPAG